MSKVLIIVLSIFVAYSQAISYQAHIQEQWENFKLEHGKMYSSEKEEQYRQYVYMNNLQKINQHNILYQKGLTSYEMGINHFGDMRKDEFLRIYSTNLIGDEDNLTQSMDDFVIYAPPSDINVIPLPKYIDWREKGAVTAVMDQGNCKSCWSFSATGVLEGQWYRKTNKLIPLSEQNLMDCSWKFKNHGCHGGLAIKALRYIRDNGGIETNASYPYNAKESRQCHYKSKNKAASVKKVVRVPQDEKQLQKAVSSVGPISVSIELTDKMQFYRRGVFNDPKCGIKIGHAVLAVGYGTAGKNDYWLIKNSWSNKWGEKGYIRMSRNKNNQCGIASRISYPIV